MKIKLILSSLIICLPYSAFALTTTQSPIQHVKLYPNFAKIERNLQVNAGETLVTLSGLAANFDINQLQYRSNNIEITAVSHIDSAINKPSGQASSQLKQQIELIQREISEQSAIIQAAELQNKFLGNITKGNALKVRKHAHSAFIAIDDAQLKKQQLAQQLQELKQDLAQIGDSEFNHRTLKFHVIAPQQGQINISYQVPYARWQPSYKAELDTQNKRIKFTRFAMIAQKTGEDWNNVRLTLSSSASTRGIEQTQPEPWFVNYQQDRPTPNNLPKSPVNKNNIKPSPRVERTNPFESVFPQFEASTLNFSTEFRSQTKATIPSSQQQIFIPLNAEEHNAKISIWAIPKQSPQAIVNAEIEQLSTQWPSGMVKLYRDGDFIGERPWHNNQNGMLNMSFGHDDQIQIKVADPLHKKTALSQTDTKMIQTQRYTIRNLHPYPVEMTLFDSSPVSQNSELITQSQYSIPFDQQHWNDQPNIHQWKINLKPKQIFELNAEHHFKYPNIGRTTGF